MRDINLNGAARRTSTPAIVIDFGEVGAQGLSGQRSLEEALRDKLIAAREQAIKALKGVGKFVLAWTVLIGFIAGVCAILPHLKGLLE